MIRPVLAAVLLTALLAGCSSNPSGSGLPQQQGIVRNPLLTQVTSCSQLETAIEDALVLEMKSQLEQIRDSDYYIGWGGLPVGAGGPVASPGTNTAGPTSVSTTNTQVAGVDEADFVQNDGTRIAVLAGAKLHLLSSWPPQAMAETASLKIDGWPRDMFLAGNQVVVFSMVYVPRAIEGSHPICAPTPVAAGGAIAVDAFCGYWGSDFTQITTVDVSDLSHPKITAEIVLPGTYLSARRIGQRVRLVMSDSLPFPDGVRYWPDLPPGTTKEERDKAFDALEAANEKLIRSRSLDDWLRDGEVRIPGGGTTPIPYSCSDFSLSSAPSRPGLLTVATVDLSTDSLKSRTSVFAEPGTVYASKETLYVAAAHWWWWPAIGQSDATYLHAFDLTDPDHAGYLGSGTVDGYVRDQYSMDELDGALRVATHLTTRVADGTPWGTLKGSNRISVLAPVQGSLQLLGKTADYGADEQTFGTRFVGPRGFVITARQVDPLFTFDLSDPAHPIKVGELQMPGFISYLHPIDDTHLLGIGREPGASSMMQLKVALLDVADLADPKVDAVQLVGEGWSYSDALWDPKAFTWLPAQKMLAIPFVDYGAAAQNLVSDLRLFQVDSSAGSIQPLGSLSMADVFLTYSGEGWSYSWSPWIRRGILADAQDGQYVYAISDSGVRSAKVASLPSWLQTVTFPPLVYP